MEAAGSQQLFFQHIKDKMPAHLSLADEVAELLHISSDSAYRRIRGEKMLSFEEIQTLSAHYKLSVDHFLHLESDSFIFSGKLNTHTPQAFDQYLEFLLQHFQFINGFEHKNLYLLLKEIRPFIHFHIPELAAFQFFVWMKSLLHSDYIKSKKFSLDDPMYERYYPIAKKIVELYNHIPATEIWNTDNINSTLRQLDFYMEAGMFNDKSEVKVLYAKLMKLVDHLEKQAIFGCKFNVGERPKVGAGAYRLFINELVLGDNTYIAELNNTRITFLNHSSLYFIATRDKKFNESIFENIQSLVKNSTMISTTGEKERILFFDKLRGKIQERVSRLP